MRSCLMKYWLELLFLTVFGVANTPQPYMFGTSTVAGFPATFYASGLLGDSISIASLMVNLLLAGGVVATSLYFRGVFTASASEEFSQQACEGCGRMNAETTVVCPRCEKRTPPQLE